MSAETKFKKKHPGIPSDWESIGEGGNALVWSDGKYAIKRLKTEVSDESKRRFVHESQIFLHLKDSEHLAVVPTVDVRNREGATEIVMKKLTGNLAKIIEEFRGKPSSAASALIPIVEALQYLASERGIHHRDIKPQNILYEKIDNKVMLYLGDFGCAYMPLSQRVTPDNPRALGAWQYRPPEYCTGYVERIDEKGDVFGLGKVLWEMIHGVKGIVFPGSLWFLEEFDLTRVFPEDAEVSYAMLIIAKTSDFRAERRPSLVNLLEMLKVLARERHPVSNEKDSIDFLKFEAIQQLQYEQRAAENGKFVTKIHTDFKAALSELSASQPESTLLEEWAAYYAAPEDYRQLNYYIQQVCEYESGVCLFQVRKWKIALVAQLRMPSNDRGLSCHISVEKDGTPYAFYLFIYNEPTGLVCEEYVDGSATRLGFSYTKEVLHNFLLRSSAAIVKV